MTRAAIGRSTVSLHNSYEMYFGPRKDPAMTTQFHTPRDMSPEDSMSAKDEAREAERLEALADEAREMEEEELDDACIGLGRRLDDIHIHDDRNHGFGHAPLAYRFQATWGEPDLDCLVGSGPTPQAAMWDLIDATEPK